MLGNKLVVSLAIQNINVVYPKHKYRGCNLQLYFDDSNIYLVGCFHPEPWSSSVDLKITHPFPTHNHLPVQFLINQDSNVGVVLKPVGGF
jgi:hypothetical protein